MIARSFKSVAWVAAIGAAALICYMFSLRGAAERADLVQLNAEVARLESSIRTLQTELGTRGRIDQLQHWASADFGFTAPVASQFIDGEVTLARFDQPAEPAMDAPVQLARAPAAAAPQATPVAPVRTAPAPAPAPQMPRVIRASAPQQPARAAAARPQAAAAAPVLRRAAIVETSTRTPATRTPATRTPAARALATRTPAAAPPARAAARGVAPTARPAARPAALVKERTLRDLSTRERAERGRGGAN